MKYAVLAALLATSHAADCDDANTGDFKATKAGYDALTTSLAKKLEAANTLKTSQDELFKTADTKSAKAIEIAQPFLDAYNTANDNHKKQKDDADAWGVENGLIAGKLSTAAEALRLAKEAQGTTEGEIANLETELTSRKAAVAEALAEQTHEEGVHKGYTDETAKKQALYDTELAKYKASREKIAAADTVADSLAKNIKDTEATKSSSATDVTNYKSATYDGKYTAFETESVKLAQCKDRKRLIKAPCLTITTCTANDPILAIEAAKTCSATDYDTKKDEWEVARKEYVRLQRVAGEALVAWEVAKDALKTEKGVRDTVLGTTEYTDGQVGYMSELNR